MTSTHHTIPHESSAPSHAVFMYTIGFVFSILLTLLAFWFSYTLGSLAVPLIVVAACIQLLVQLTFFLHLGSKATPTSWTVLFSFALIIIGIVVGGTLWIMHNLNRLHMMPVTNDTLYEHGQPAPQNELY